VLVVAETMRLFVAVYPPSGAAAHLEQHLAGLHVTRAGARLARRENWHVTLAFLGDVGESRLAAATEALDRAAGTWRSSADPLEVRLAGGGRFGRGRFTVLWVGVEGEPLAALASAVRRELRRGRVPYDHKPFRPHLTIARPGDKVDPAGVDADRATLAAYRGPVWPVRTVELVRSHLGPRPTYDHLHRSAVE
jgi:RNA 2',3'-cyclic 3'-phosphodiesterase